MILIPQPALALNQYSEGAPADRIIPYRDHYSMFYNRIVTEANNMVWLKNTILDYARRCSSGKLEALVINAHGWVRDGVLIGNGLNLERLPLFVGSGELRDKIKRIWITSCGTASTARGEEFCQQLAIQLNTKVVASNQNQTVDGDDRYPTGEIYPMWRVPLCYIDEFEGTVWQWLPDGRRMLFSTIESPFVSPDSGVICEGRVDTP